MFTFQLSTTHLVVPYMLRMWLSKYYHTKHLLIILLPQMIQYVGFPADLSLNLTANSFAVTTSKPRKCESVF